MSDLTKSIQLPEEISNSIKSAMDDFLSELSRDNPRNIDKKIENYQYYTVYGYINPNKTNEMLLVAGVITYK